MKTRNLWPSLTAAALGATLGGALLFFPALAPAGLDEGVAAYDAKDFGTAMTELKPLADQGNPQAQFYVGRMYALGEGTLKHYSLAHTYLTLAASQGVTDALMVKANISDSLSQRDIIESLKRQTDLLQSQQAAAQAGNASGESKAEAQQARSGSAQDTEVSLVDPAAPESDGIAKMDRRQLVRAVQEELNRLGYKAGAPDGLYGPTTKGAIEKYQDASKLEADGKATPELLRTLRAAQPS